jgi:predicted anti-sigma-YlaC factor YlaD
LSVNGDPVRELLPDYILGTLSDLESAAVRRHLRGCSSCRSEASALDEGVALFASAAHAEEPPPELKDRVMAVLADEWTETPQAARIPRRWLVTAAVAAAAILAIGSMVWAGLAERRGDRFAAQAAVAAEVREQARSYQEFLDALGGRDVRVATLTPVGDSAMQGSAVLYDSERGQSWVLVFLRSAGGSGMANVSISGGGQAIPLHTVELAPDGDGATWLVTSSDITKVRTVRVTDGAGNLIAVGTASADHE